MTLITDTDLLHDRLKFLYMLRDRTVFGEHAELRNLIDDYERTLKLRRQLEERAEAGNHADKRGPKAKKVEPQPFKPKRRPTTKSSAKTRTGSKSGTGSIFGTGGAWQFPWVKA